MNPHTEQLRRYGVCVLPVFEDVTQIYQQLQEAVASFPEYKTDLPEPSQRVLGGFGALGNPSSFHHPLVRALRLRLKEHTKPMWRDYITGGPLTHLELLYDRLCYRDKRFGKPQKESWHRDEHNHALAQKNNSPSLLKGGDELFGGWLNLTPDVTQTFVCLCGSQRPSEGAGFQKELDQAHFDKMYEFNRYTSLQVDDHGKVLVPPGHLLIFSQGLLHAVESAVPRPNWRLFTGWRLSRGGSPLYTQTYAWQLRGEVPLLPSGQKAPMYSVMHINTICPRYEREGRQMEWDPRKWGPAVFVDQIPRVQWGLPQRYMPSLMEMGLLSEEYIYTQEDIRVLQPEELVIKVEEREKKRHCVGL